ncbi:NADP-dependent oxidoreductase domain-containing protein [Lasiosphaeris hirsuta]|uniref:NADP-dependent oxidoreductase domain-containing protein n=1 Tax=Lasiosphaeris hirsuta TaxID=260670 RepID=A0AA40DV82_9PEZI|nr:NADP-dependent oxidoreductase domain-containing protein [Lasiosphaeris hirsuta]
MHHANRKTPIEETMRALAELQAEGKIKHIGLSAISSATLRRAVKIAPVAAVQADYSPFVLDIERPTGGDLLATCRELGVAFVAAMPLGRGMITSTFASGQPVGDEKDMRVHVMPRFQEANREKNVKVISQFEELAKKKGCTVAQLSLAWLLKQGHDIFPIPGTKKIKYLEENWASLDIELSDEEEAEVRGFIEKAEIAGHPLPPQFESYSFVDTVEEA